MARDRSRSNFHSVSLAGTTQLVIDHTISSESDPRTDLRTEGALSDDYSWS